MEGKAVTWLRQNVPEFLDDADHFAPEAWLHVLEDLIARGLKAPELLIVDGGKGLEAALAGL